MKGRRHRREKPGRALEQVYYTFDIIGNLGAYRDLQRHRLLSQERQDFTTAHGYDTPPEITEAGFDDDYRRCMDRAAEIHERVRADHPREAQYLVPFAYRTRWYMKMNLREAVHIGELRTMPQGHPDYRSHHPGDVAPDRRGAPEAGRLRQVHRLENLPPGAARFGAPHRVQAVGTIALRERRCRGGFQTRPRVHRTAGRSRHARLLRQTRRRAP